MDSERFRLLDKKIDQGFIGVNKRLDKINGSVANTLEKHNACKLDTKTELTEHGGRIHDLERTEEKRPSTVKIITILIGIFGLMLTIATYINVNVGV